MADRNAIARAAAKLGASFGRKNGSDVIVPERLAQGGGGAEGGVAVCVIGRGDTLCTNFAMALAATQYMMGRLGLNFFMINRKGDVPAENRNVALDQAIAAKAAYAVLIDSNATFPPTALPRLLTLAREHGADILGPTVCRREHPHDNLALPKEGEQTVTVGNLVEVRALPAAFLVIKLEALKKMKRPYFRYPVIQEGYPIPGEWNLPGMEEGKPYTINDTVYFCEAARREGLKVWLDTELSCFMVNWGEAGYQLTGAEEGPQYRIVESGQIDPASKPQAEAGNDGPMLEIAR